MVAGPPPAGNTGTPDATSEPLLDAESAGTTTYDAAGPVDAAGTDSAAAAERTLSLTFSTIPQGGNYSPTNAGVAWVEDDQGKWVHTFEIWVGATYIQRLAKYVAAGGPNYSVQNGLPFLGAGPAPATPPPDVISSATYHIHKLHSGDLWNLKDASGTEVPDGNYQVVIEVIDDVHEQAYEFPFEKTGKPFQSTPPDNGFLVGVKIIMQ